MTPTRLSVLASMLAAPTLLADPAVSIETVARYNDPIPGRPGFTFQGVTNSGSEPVINNRGEVALTCRVSSGGAAGYVLAGAPGALQTVFGTGDQAPGLDKGVVQVSASVNLVGGLNLIFNDDGGLCWIGFLSGPGVVGTGAFANNSAIWEWSATTGQRLLVRAQDQAPFLPTGTVFGSLNSSDYAYVNNGVLGLGVATLVTSPFGPGPSGMWTLAHGAPPMAVIAGDDAPQLPPGITYSSLQLANSGGVINNEGSVAFEAFLTGPGITNDNFRAVIAGPPDDLRLVARMGDDAPGTTTTFRLFFNDQIIVADNDQVAFTSALNPSSALAFHSGTFDQVELVARQGQQVPGMDPGVFYNNVGGIDAVIDSTGRVAFGAWLGGTGAFTTALMMGSPPDIEPIAVTGDPVPGMPGFTFTGSFETADVHLNNAGQAAFVASVTDGTVGVEAVFFVTSEGDVVPVARGGTSFQTDRGSFFASRLFLHGRGSPATGFARGLNDHGQLVFTSRWNGVDEGVFVATLDENPPCNDADVAEPFGLLDLSDVSAFVAGFVSQTPVGDIDGNGLWDLTDVSLFVGAFTAGCP